MKNPAQLPSMLTRETAAGVGMLFGGILVMTASLGDAMVGMMEGVAEGIAEGTGGSVEKPPEDPKEAAKRALLKTLAKDLEAVFAKHGLDKDRGEGPPTAAERKRIVASGRLLLADVIALMQKMPSEGKDSDFKFGPDKNDLDARNLRYKQLSSTRVQITDLKRPKEKLEARLEDGMWRLHVLEAAKMLEGGGVPSMGRSEAAP